MTARYPSLTCGSVPLLFVEMLGAACATAIANNPAYAQGYTDANVGGLLGAIVIPPLGRFGEFCVVILALSIVANNCPNIYSVSLSLQLLSTYSLRVPRFIWTLLGTLAYCAIAIPAYYRFEQVLTYFMLFIGYWLAIYEGISLTEHFVFRRGIRGYEPADYLNKNRLPVGAAAVLAFGFGIMGAVLGMSQPWFVGPIGRLIGDPIFGGDVGFELGFGFSVVSYLVLRTLEKRHFGR